MDGEGDQAQEAVVEGAQGRIRATCRMLLLCVLCICQIQTFASLYLEEPYRCINSNAQRSARLLELLDSELGEGDALAGANLFVDTARISIASTFQVLATDPWIPIATPCSDGKTPSYSGMMVLQLLWCGDKIVAGVTSRGRCPALLGSHVSTSTSLVYRLATPRIPSIPRTWPSEVAHRR